MALWYGGANNFVTWSGFSADSPTATAAAVSTFWSTQSLWFDLYFALCVGLFAAAWNLCDPHPWSRWSILGSALIVYLTYFQVEVSVAINRWYGPFYDLIQAALARSASVTIGAFYSELATFAEIAFVAVAVGVLTRFFISHYIFRWRTAMNDYYRAHWAELRMIEGASQRVQEDTMRFASTMESLGANLISAVMTLIAFFPVLLRLSANVTDLPLVGAIPYPLVVAALVWSALGTGFLALVGIRLPGSNSPTRKLKPLIAKNWFWGRTIRRARRL